VIDNDLFLEALAFVELSAASLFSPCYRMVKRVPVIESDSSVKVTSWSFQ
jgi:hypothetical protein